MSGGDKLDQYLLPEAADHQVAEHKASQGLLADAYDWCAEHPKTTMAIGVAAAVGVGYLTRGKWMPAISRLGTGATEVAVTGATQLERKAGFDATAAGLKSMSELAHPELQGWRTALGGYKDIGVDTAGTMIYRGARAGAFDATNTLVVQGQVEAKTLYNAISREGFLQRAVWQRGAAGTATELGEVTLPGKTRFLLQEGKSLEIASGGKLIDLKNGMYEALSSENAAKLFTGL